MPRNELNNPSARIDRLLAEMSDLLYWTEQLTNVAMPKLTNAELMALPTKPAMVEFQLETQRRHLTRGKVNAVRKSMQLLRERGFTQHEARTGNVPNNPTANARAATQSAEKFSLEEIEAMVEKVKDEDRRQALGDQSADPASKMDPKKLVSDL